MKWRPKFSLLTLMFAALLAGSGMALWWNWASWRLVRTIAVGKNYEHQFSPDMRWFLIGGEDACALWDLRTGRQVSSVTIDGEKLQGLALSVDGQRAAAVTHKLLTIWDAQSGEKIKEVAHSAWGDLVFSADHEWLLSGKKLISTRLEKEELLLGIQPGDRTIASSAAFMKQQLTDELKDKQLELAGLATGLKEYLLARKDMEMRAVGSPSGKVLLTSVTGKEGNQVWDWSGMRKQSESKLLRASIDIIFFADDTRAAYSVRGGEDDRICTQIVDLATGAVMATLAAEIDSNHKSEQQISGDGERIVLWRDFVGDYPVVTVHHWKTGKECSVVAYGNRDAILSPDGKRFALCNLNANLDRFEFQMIDADTGSLLAILDYGTGHGAVKRFSDDGMTLYTNSANGLLDWNRQRPERWWGVLVLVEFWAVVVSAGLMGWSVWRDGGGIGQATRA